MLYFRKVFFCYNCFMKVKVLYFSEAAKVSGKKEETVDFPGGTVRDFLKMLCEFHPEISQTIGLSMIAVNLKYESYDYILEDGDVLAIIPPVEGG